MAFYKHVNGPIDQSASPTTSHTSLLTWELEGAVLRVFGYKINEYPLSHGKRMQYNENVRRPAFARGHSEEGQHCVVDVIVIEAM